MSILDRFRAYLRPAVAAARLAAAEPYSGQPQPAPTTPAPVYSTDQPIMIPEPHFRPGYHDHTYEATWAPINYGGVTIALARAYLEQHDTGSSFLGSYTLSIALTRFPAVFSALGVRIAPSVALERQILGGQRGLAKRVAQEVEAQLCPRGALLPSPCFPSTLWGSIAIELAMMGFAVLQHVYGPPDAFGVRRVYTRRWPTWAVQYQAWRKTYVALTNETPVDILNDGKFTLIGKTDVPHLQGALRALVMPALDGSQTMQARAQWVNRFSDPKLVATMSEKIAPGTAEGKALLAVLQTLIGPGGRAVLPAGTKLDAIGLSAEASAVFKDTLDSDNGYVWSVLTGVNAQADGGVYKPLVFWGIIRATVGDDIAAITRGINQGHVYPYTRFNYAAAIDEEIAADEGAPADMPRGWVDPVLSIPLPDPEKDERIGSYTRNALALTAQVKAEREAGAPPDQARINLLAGRMGVDPFTLADVPPAGAEIFAYDLDNCVVTINDQRANKGKEAVTWGNITAPEAKKRIADGWTTSDAGWVPPPKGTQPAPPNAGGTEETAPAQGTEDQAA